MAYGTGVALPRLTQVIEKTKKKGYHDTIIPKNLIRSFLKILKEVDEAKDAHLQGNKIMELVELSDFYGAIKLYLEKNHPSISMKDIKTMNDVTSRVFKNGQR